MIISSGRGYVFVHIPKTAGTSLALALERRAMRDDILIGDTPKAKRRQRRLSKLTPRGRLWKHSTLADIDGLLSPEDLSRMFIFTLVRNPWDRAVSYFHWLKDQSFEHPAVALSRRLPFDAFLREPSVCESFRRSPAEHYVTDVCGDVRCSAFIRLEHFQQDAGSLFDHLGFEFDLPHTNASDRVSDYRSYYSDESRRLIADACAQDIARFKYDFG